MRKEEFGEWLKNEGKSLNVASSYKAFINKISKHYSQENNENIDLYNINDISYIKNLEKYYDRGGKYENFGDEAHGGPRAAIKAYVRFIENKPKNPPPLKGHISHPIEEDTLSVKIFERAIEKIKEINRECKNRNKHPVFDSSVHDYTDEIKESCKSLSKCKDLQSYIYKVIFKDFILNLYIIIYETTRKPNPKYNSRNGESFYNFYLPDEFLLNDMPTKDFMDIVGTFRHHYAHLEPEYKEKVMINKKSYGDALNKLLKSRNEPKQRENFQNLQIEVLKLFETSMEKLLEIIKDDLNHPNPLSPPKTGHYINQGEKNESSNHNSANEAAGRD